MPLNDLGLRAVVSTFLGVVESRQTYRNLGYLFAKFPLGMAYFTVFVTGLALAVPLIPFVVGVPLLIGVLGVANYTGVVEARLANALLDADVDYEPVSPADRSVISYGKAVVIDPWNYAYVAYFLGTFVVGVVMFVALLVGVVVPVSLLIAPLVYWLPGVRYELLAAEGTTIDLGPSSVRVPFASTDGVGPIIIDTVPEALLASVVGLLSLLVALHVANALARVFEWVTIQLFDSSR